VFIGGRAVDSWYGGVVQSEIHRELSAVPPVLKAVAPHEEAARLSKPGTLHAKPGLAALKKKRDATS